MHLLVLVVLAQAFEPLEVGERFATPESARCQGCHPRHYSEWISSVHSATSRRLLVPPHANRDDLPTGNDLQDRACAACHGGDVVEVLGERRHEFEVNLGHAAERSITCVTCHQFAAESIPKPTETDAGTVADPRPREERRNRKFHTDLKPALALREGTLCGPCHQVTAPNGLVIERTYSQFLESAYPQFPQRDGIGCIRCHMNSYGGAMVPDGIYHAQLHRHDFIGTDVATNPLPAVDSQRKRVQRFLAAAATMFVRPPEKVVAGQSLQLSVEVVNSGAGHNVPAGFPVERRMWLEVEAVLDDGTSIFRSGHSRREEHGAEAQPDPIAVDFTDRFLDASGKEVLFWWQAASIEERSLRAHERRHSTFEIAVPSSAAGRTVHVEVVLRFQSCSPRQFRELGLDSVLGKHPIFDVHTYRVAPIPIVERLFAEGTVVVPEDVASISEAVERAQPGAEIVVLPGTYLLEEPIRFAGKPLTLRSLEGPETTVLKRVGEAAAAVGSVVVFDSGETRSARLEGFTITGGTGTRWADALHGGGIFVRGADPMIVGNRATGNTASGGNGGGTALIDSKAYLCENVVVSNRAGSGGGIAVVGSSDATIKGGRITGNAAGKDGGGLLAAALVSVSDLEVTGNQAFRGGGAAVPKTATAEDVRLVVVGSHIGGNSAPLGGAVLVEAGELRCERTLIAGNVARIGGGIYALGASTSEFANVTMAHNKAARDGAMRTRDGATLRFHNSIVSGNTPAGLAAADFGYSLVEDPNIVGVGGTNVGGAPLFHRAGSWTPCSSTDEPGCVPVRWVSRRPPRPVAYGRWTPGRYGLAIGSPALNAGSPDDSPDPDDSRADMGAFARQMQLRGFIRGDVDGNGQVDVADVLEMLRVLAGRRQLPCADAADVTDRGGVGPVDLVVLLLHVFGANVAPAAPFPKCGIDPTPGDGVGCFETYSKCE